MFRAHGRRETTLRSRTDTAALCSANITLRPGIRTSWRTWRNWKRVKVLNECDVRKPFLKRAGMPDGPGVRAIEDGAIERISERFRSDCRKEEIKMREYATADRGIEAKRVWEKQHNEAQ